MTDKLYYSDSHLFIFCATVLKCELAGQNRYLTVLDRTAFFPEGGGQKADTGYISGVHVSHVFEKNGEIFHECDSYLVPDTEVSCTIDREQRLRRMQNHSGEHIISGLIYKNFGFSNVGFHMGDSFMTIDFSGELSDADLEKIESTANEIIRENVPVKTWFPAPEELEKIDYRSKLDLKENVRLVSIEGCDICACCAPHVSRTGEIGVIKIISSMRHRGGTRIEAVCGMDALDNYRIRQANAEKISALLSAKQDEIAAAVERILRNAEFQKERIAALSLRNVSLVSEAAQYSEGNICLFDDLLDDVAVRELVNQLVEKCSGIVAVFSVKEDSGYRYIIGSRSIDLRMIAKHINSGIDGKGGGSPSMIQGSCRADRERIREFINGFNLNEINERKST